MMAKSQVGSRIRARPRLMPPSYVAMLLVMFILPFFSVDEYSILKNTTSHLGAQGAPYAWAMNVVFALLGAASVLDGWEPLSDYWLHKALLSVFGASLVLTAVFQHAPIVQGIAFSAREDSLHSVFASATGASFTLFAIAGVFVESSRIRRLVAGGVAAVAVILSMLIFSVADYAGIWQRAMFIVAFAWLMYFLYARARTSPAR